MASRADLLPRDFHVPSMKGDFFKAKIYRILGFLFIYDRYLFLGFLLLTFLQREEKNAIKRFSYFISSLFYSRFLAVINN